MTDFFPCHRNKTRLWYLVHVDSKTDEAADSSPITYWWQKDLTRQKSKQSIQSSNYSWTGWRFVVNLASKWSCHPKFHQCEENLIGQTFQSHIHRCNKIIHIAHHPMHFYGIYLWCPWWEIIDPSFRERELEPFYCQVTVSHLKENLKIEIFCSL